MFTQEILLGLNLIQLIIVVIIGGLLFKKYPVFVSGVLLCFGGLNFLGGVAIFISLIIGLLNGFKGVFNLGSRKTSKSRR